MAVSSSKDSQGYLESYYLIDEILPAQELHLLAGPSGVNKTTWLLTMLVQWARGESVLGHVSHPVPFIYCATDRSERSLHRTLKRLGILPSAIPVIPLKEMKKKGAEMSLTTLLKLIKEKQPTTKLIVLESIGLFIPEGRTNDYSRVAKFLQSLTLLCEENDLTFLCVHHTSKQKEGEKYTHPRERLLGSMAWAAFAETVIAMEFFDPGNPKDPYRRMTVMPRNAPDSFHSFKISGEGGRPILVPSSVAIQAATNSRRPETKKINETIENFLTVMRREDRREFTIEEIERVLGPDVSRRTLFRRLDDLVSRGLLSKSERGIYSLEERSLEAAFGLLN